MPQLPIEVLETILEQLQYHAKDLLSCASTCTSMRLIAQKRLFRVVVNLHPNMPDRVYISFFNAIISSSDRLATHVRVLKLELRSPFDAKNETLSNRALQLMRNLTHLAVIYRGHRERDDSMPILYRAPFKLRMLHWEYINTDNDLISRSLRQQHDLRYLAIPRQWHPFSIDEQSKSLLPQLCPRLECIEGPTKVLYTFLRCHSVNAAMWTHANHFHPVEDETAIGPPPSEAIGGISRLKYLRFDLDPMDDGRKATLTNFSKWMTSLQVLELVFLWDTHLDLSFLENLCQLQRLIVSRPTVFRISVGVQNIVSRAFRHSSSLQFVDLQVESADHYFRITCADDERDGLRLEEHEVRNFWFHGALRVLNGRPNQGK